MGFSRQEYWSRLPFSSPGDLPDPGIELRFTVLQPDALTSESPGKPDRIFEKTEVLKKTSQTEIHGQSPCPLQWPTTSWVCFSLNPNKSTSYLSQCLTEFLQWDIRAWASLGPKIGGFGQAQVPAGYDWMTKHIAQGPCHMGLSPNLR